MPIFPPSIWIKRNKDARSEIIQAGGNFQAESLKLLNTAYSFLNCVFEMSVLFLASKDKVWGTGNMSQDREL